MNGFPRFVGDLADVVNAGLPGVEFGTDGVTTARWTRGVFSVELTKRSDKEFTLGLNLKGAVEHRVDDRMDAMGARRAAQSIIAFLAGPVD